MTTCLAHRSKYDMRQRPNRDPLQRMWRIFYTNVEPALYNEFCADVKDVFGLRVTAVRNHDFVFGAKWAYERIAALGAGKSREWYVASEIFAADDAIRAAWLRAFFDDESHIENGRRRIVLNMVNLSGLQQVQILLRSFQIESRITGPYFQGRFYSYHLTISGKHVLAFGRHVGFIHPKKRQRLTEIENGSTEIRTQISRSGGGHTSQVVL